MVIAHNMMAMNAQRQFNIVGNRKQKSTEKLSSGYRINRAADDAAGLAISEKLRRQIRGLNQGAENVTDGISLLQVADGALAEVHDMLNRVTELSVQSANGTNTEEDRDAIQSEVSQIMAEIGRICDTTSFNDRLVFRLNPYDKPESTDEIFRQLANNTYPAITSDVVAADGTIIDQGTASITLELMSNVAKAYEIYTNNYGPANNPTRMEQLWGQINTAVKSYGSSPYYKSDIDIAQSFVRKYANGGGMMISDLMSYYNSAYTSAGGSYLAQYNTAAMTQFSHAVYSRNDSEFLDYLARQQSGISIISSFSGYQTLADIINPSGTPATEESILKGIADGYKYLLGYPSDEEYAESSKGIWIQASAESEDGLYIQLENMSLKTLGLQGTDVSTADGANNGIDRAKAAMKKVSELRTKMGAQQNRLEHTYNNVTNIAENTQAAESKLRDTDMAKEIVQFSIQNILSEAGMQMMAQANQLPEGVLGLLQ